MGSHFLEWVSGISKEANGGGYSIAPGTVTDNFNLLGEGRVQVHLVVAELDPWARVASVGGGGGRGFMWIPQIGDEVLVAFNANNSRGRPSDRRPVEHNEPATSCDPDRFPDQAHHPDRYGRLAAWPYH